MIYNLKLETSNNSMGKKIFVLHHLGLGDHFVMNGFLHLLLHHEKPEEILLVCKQHNVKTVEKMYNGYPEISIYPIKDLNELYPSDNPGKLINSIIENGYLYVGFGVHGNNQKYLELDVSWANCFYKQVGLDPKLRFSMFQFPKNMDRSVELARNVIKEVGSSYIIVHDDPSRGFSLNETSVKKCLKEDGYLGLPIVYLGKDRYKSILFDGLNNPYLEDLIETETLYDYCDLLKNATACHMLDSSIALLLDYTPCKEGQKRYMHEYAKVGEILSTDGLFQKEWTLIKNVE